MDITLSDDLLLEVERANGEPVRVENPRNHKQYVIIPAERFASSNGGPKPVAGQWTEEQDARRMALIDRDIAWSITSAEAVELEQLQRGVDEYLHRVAPLPMTAARKLHGQLRRALGVCGPDASRSE